MIALLGGGFGVAIVLKTLLYGDTVPGYPSLMAMITVLSGIQLLTIGLLGEYLGKTYMESKQRPVYLVREVVEPAAASGSMRANVEILDAHRQ